MTVKKAHWNDKVWIDEQTQVDGPLRASNEAYREGWERCFGRKATMEDVKRAADELHRAVFASLRRIDDQLYEDYRAQQAGEKP